MGRVKRSAKRHTPAPADLAKYAEAIAQASDQDLVPILQRLSVWRYARSDLHNWVAVLDRFDDILGDITTSYELTKLQTNDFTPKDKELVLEILRFQRVLLENCTNRKLFSSYDRLNDLLLTSDLEILESTLFTLLRLAQQYGTHTPFEAQLGYLIVGRVLNLCRGWEQLAVNGQTLHSLASDSAPNQSEPVSRPRLYFYPTAGQSNTGPMEVDLIGTTTLSTSSSIHDRVSLLAEEKDISLEDQNIAVNKLRLACLLYDKSLRERLLGIHLLALATYMFLSSEDAVTSHLFLLDPDLIEHIATLLQTSSNTSDSVRAAAILALDACAHLRSRLSEVLNAVSAHVSHGPLMSVFRATVENLETASPDLIDACFSLVAYIASSPAHISMLMSAGVLPVLLRVLSTTADRRDSYIPRATGLIDAILYSNTQALPQFTNIDGITVLVASVKNEMQLLAGTPAPDVTDYMNQDSITLYRTNPLKAELRSLHRLLQSAGGTEGLRNLVDSDLPKLIKRIFEDWQVYGPRVYSLSINLMATFIHNEPTSLTVLQEIQLPQTLYSQLEQQIPASHDVISAVPNAVGAICLNQAGIDDTKKRGAVVTNLLKTIVSSDFSNVPDNGEAAHGLGAGVDELIRHHPPLRSIVLDGIFEILAKASDDGRAFEPPADAEADYRLIRSPVVSEEKEVDKKKPAPTNAPLVTLGKLFQLLEGMMRNDTLCREFLERGGLEQVLATIELPCVPILFIGFTTTAHALSHLLRAIGDHDHVKLVNTLVDSIKSGLENTVDLWKSAEADVNWQSLHNYTATSKLQTQLDALRFLSTHIALLTDTFNGFTWTHGKVITFLCKSLGASDGNSFIADAGALHRVCARQQFVSPSDSASSDPSSPAIPLASPATIVHNSAPDLHHVQRQAPNKRDPSQPGSVPVRLHGVLTKAFRAFVRVLHTKRQPDPAHTKAALALSRAMAEVLLGHLDNSTSPANSTQVDVVSLGLVLLLLFDDRGFEGHLQMPLFIEFEKLHGIQAILAVSHRLIDQVDRHPPTAADKTDQSEPEPAATAVVRATGGLRIVLQVVGSLVKPKALLENPQTHALQQRDRQAGNKSAFDPIPIFLQLRCSLFPLIIRIWSASWLALSPPAAVRLCASAFLSVLEGKHETPSESTAGETSGRFVMAHALPRPQPVAPAPLTADSTRVAQLTDMGFSRAAAEWALLRTRNNIAAATEMIISMPHLFEDMTDPVPPAVENVALDTATQPSTSEEAATPAQATTSAPAAEENVQDVEMADMQHTSVPSPTAQPDVESLRKDIAAQRAVAAEAAPEQALKLLQQAEEYVQDVLPIFLNDARGLRIILDTVTAINQDSETSYISFGLRLLAIFLRTKDNLDLATYDGTIILEKLLSLRIDPQSPPIWTPRVMLLAEIVITANWQINKAKIGDPEDSQVQRDDLPISDLVDQMSVLCRNILRNHDSARDLYVSAFRLAVLLEQRRQTQGSADSGIVLDALQALTADPSKSPGCQPYLAMIARHAVEDTATLGQAMRREIRHFFSPSHSKVSDINHVVSQLRAVINRAPDLFLKLIARECVLIDPSPPQSVYHIRLKEPEKQSMGEADVFGADSVTHPVISALVHELRRAVVDHHELTSGSEEASPAETLSSLLFKIGSTVSILTELIGSYLPAKTAFVAALQLPLDGEKGSKVSSTAGITAFLLDLVACVNLQKDLSEAALARQQSTPGSRLALFGWGTSAIVSLCTDPASDAEVDGETSSLLITRKAVIDCIAKILRDHSNTDANARYGQIWAMAELTYRLLVVRPINSTNSKIDQGAAMAKIMLEKNLFGLFTNVTADMDFNFPEIRAVLFALLRCLEQLSKSAVRWAQTRKLPTDAPISDLASSFSGSSDSEDQDGDIEDDEDEDDDMVGLEDMAELANDNYYRNSALADNYADNYADEHEEENDDDDDDDEVDDDGDEEMLEYDDELDDDEVIRTSESSSNGHDDDDDDHSLHAADLTDFVDDEEDHGGDDREDIAEVWDRAVDDDEYDGEVAWDEGDEAEIVDDAEYTDEEGEDEEALDVDGAMPDSMELASEMELDLNEVEGGFEVFEGANPVRGDPTGAGPSSLSGWGWTNVNDVVMGGDSRDARRSRLIESDPAAALFAGRSPRTAAAGAASEVAQHPLLQSTSTNPETTRPAMNARRMQPTVSNHLNEILQSIASGHMPSPSNIMERLSSIRNPTGGEGVIINATGPGQIELHISNVLPAHGAPSQSSSQGSPAAFGSKIHSIAAPVPTLSRWTQELTSFGGLSREAQSRFVTHIVNALLPAARAAAAEEEERLKAEAAQQEAAATEARQEELNAALSIPLPESRASPLPPPPNEDGGQATGDVEMEADDNPPADPVAENVSLARTLIMINGREVDITDTGIDVEFLQALPDDMRAEVVEQHMREQNRATNRPTAAPAPSGTTGPSDISPEFLNALPPEIRAELLQEQNAPRPRTGDGVPAGAHMLTAHGLMDQILELTSDLGSIVVPGQPAHMHGGAGPSHLAHMTHIRPHRASRLEQETQPEREALQLVDRPGIASLIRLLFIPDVSKKGYLYHILVNLCGNTKSRLELMSLLLTVIQEGSGDLASVDRGFQQLSLRQVSSPRFTTPKGKQPAVLAVTPSSPSVLTHVQAEHVPAFIAQRCFDALTQIVGGNPPAIDFFLNEQDQPVGLRKLSGKKMKGKEKSSMSKFPIVILLNLFERESLVAVSGMMETLTGLVALVTKPIPDLVKSSAVETSAPIAPEADRGMAGADQPIADSASTATVTVTPGASQPQAATSGPVSTGGTAQSTKPQQPPVLPESTVRLLPNCLTIGECSSRTFGNSITLMQHVSSIPGVKEILTEEMTSRAQALGGVLNGELQELAAKLAETKAQLDAAAVAGWSSRMSHQAQLLRLLKTIELLYAPKADVHNGQGVDTTPPALTEVFSALSFEGMWHQLGLCLRIVEAQEQTEQVATVLLPLVETLMVVCKYRSDTAQEAMSPTPEVAPDLFVSFTNAHKKTLNAIVRNRPSLLGGSFSLLIRNSKVLDFDNKRNWFFQRLKKRRNASRPSPALLVTPRRQTVFQDSFNALRYRTGEEIRNGRLSIKFQNEEGIDAGGVTREWFSVLARQIFDPNYGLFEPCAADAQTYQPNKHSGVANEDLHLAYFKFVGRIIGKAVLDGRLLDAYFNRAFYKQILGRSVDIRDLESVDPEYHKSLQWMLENNIEGVIDQEFTVEDDQFGEKKIVELKEGGSEIPVTEENKEEYVRLVVSYRLDNSIKEQIAAFLQGFYEIIPKELIQIFDPDQLELLISGITTIDVDELKNATQMSGWKASDPEITWFWRALRSFSQEERARFLMFVTSSSRVPLGGFTQLQGASGIQPFQIQQLYSKEGSLPQASTCFNLLLLPKYASYDNLRERLLFAMTETSGFGKA